MSNWIKCSDQLPELDIDVLVYHAGSFYIASRIYNYDLEKECDSYIWYIDSWVLYPDIKFWQLLPEVPNE